jgi:hypothetical protein
MIGSLFPETGMINPARRRAYHSLALPWRVTYQICQRMFASMRTCATGLRAKSIIGD